MADLNDFNLPIYTTNYHDFVDTVRENIKRVKVTADAAIPLAQKGVASGVASLDGTGKLLSSFLPVGVVLEAPNDGQNYVRRSLSWQILPVIDDSAMIGNVALRPLKAGATQVMWVELAGQELSKTAYPRLWAWVQTYAPFAASLAAWNAGSQGMFLDASASTFRVPSFAGFPYLRVVTGARAPGSTEAAMVGPHPHPATASGGSHSHTFTDLYHDGGTSEPSIATQGGSGYGLNPAGHAATTNVSGVGAITVTVNNNTGTENRPANIAYRAFIYAGVPL